MPHSTCHPLLPLFAEGSEARVAGLTNTPDGLLAGAAVAVPDEALLAAAQLHQQLQESPEAVLPVEAFGPARLVAMEAAAMAPTTITVAVRFPSMTEESFLADSKADFLAAVDSALPGGPGRWRLETAMPQAQSRILAYVQLKESQRTPFDYAWCFPSIADGTIPGNMKVRTTEGGVEVSFTALLPASVSPRVAQQLSDTLESKPDQIFSPTVFGASEITVTSPRQMERASSGTRSPTRALRY